MGLFDRRAQTRELTAATAELAGVLSHRLPGEPSRVMVSFGPKGGGNKTTSLASVALAMVDHNPMWTMVADFNPDKGTIVGRLLASPAEAQYRLTHLAQWHEQVTDPSRMATFIDTAGRLMITHNQDITPEDVAAITAEQYAGILTTLRRYARLTFVDGGTSLVHPSMTETLATADHLIIGCIATVDALQLAYDGLADLRRMGHRDLIEKATVILGVSNPDGDQAGIDAAVAWYRQTCGDVQIVPYDPVLASGGLIAFDHLAVATRLAFTRAALHVARTIYTPGAASAGVYLGQQP